MDVQALRYFLITAKHLNYSKAAEELYISRQALRQQIQLLEKEFNGELFINHKNKLSLSLLGEYIYTNGANVVSNFDTLISEVHSFSNTSKQLKMSYCTSTQPFLYVNLDNDIREFINKYEIEVNAYRLTHDEIVHELKNNLCDCALMFMLETQSEKLEFLPLKRFPAAISHSKDLHFTHSPLTFEDIKNYKMIGVGALETAFEPLYKDCLKRNAKLNYEIVPHAINAFHKVMNNQAIMFDTLYEAPTIDDIYDVSNTPYADYTWFFGLVYDPTHFKKDKIKLFYNFLLTAFERYN